jgi:dinuclear metal center YbgI/SA1388 family protein
MTSGKPRSFTVGQVAAVLDAIAPPSMAQSWDNVGLLVGDRAAPCRRVILCIDLTTPVLDEAIAARCELILAYHPPLFHPVKRLLADSPDTDAIVHRAIAHGMAIYSPHTALDAARGGTNDVIAGFCALADVQPFEYVSAATSQSKLVTFVPAEQLEQVASALFAAGAGRIGDYEQCSYRLDGQGTFFGTEATDPRLGRKGRLERVAETRLETVVPNRHLPEVVAALRQTHPYEEPAFDIYPLMGEPCAGMGRIGQLPAGTTLRALARKLERATRSKLVTIVGDPGTKVRSAAVCVGAAGRLPLEGQGAALCDVIVTGEIRHHDALAIARAGKAAVALGHWESERPVLSPLAKQLTRRLPGLRTALSQRDRSPFRQP